MISADDMTKLRISLAALPGFIAIGLHCHNDRAGEGLVCGIDTNGDVRFCGSSNDPDNWRPGFLDASDASTRDRLARWLAARVGMEVGCTASLWRLCPYRKLWSLLGETRQWFGSRDTAAEIGIIGRAVKGQNGVHEIGGIAVPSLADLDPTDDRRLSDGSRYGDALAIALVAQHVGARP